MRSWLIVGTILAAALFGLDIVDHADGESAVEGDSGAATEDADTQTPTATPGGYGPNPAAVRELFYERLNEFRAERARTQLSPGGPETDAAQAHSADMGEREYFSHTSPEGHGFDDRVRAAGGSCAAGGENIAQTWWQQSVAANDGSTIYIDSAGDVAAALFEQWYGSPPHREIMLRQGVERVGLGIATASDGKIYGTLVVC